MTLLLIGCAHEPPKTELQKISDATTEPAGGFYLLAKLPVERLQQLGVSTATVTRAAQSVGAFTYIRNYTYDEATARSRFASYCATEGSRELNPEFCTEIERAVATSLANRVPITFTSFHFGCSGVILDDHFITAKHCLPSRELLIEPRLRVKVAGKYETFKLISSAHTYTLESFDLATFEIEGMTPALRKQSAKLSSQTLLAKQPVFGVGFPILNIREARASQFDYPLEPRTQRVALGRVALVNSEAKRFCAYTNDDDVANIEAWDLVDNCERVDRSNLKYKWREEADPLLVNIDMTWGMSGSPLFDVLGDLIGIGSNVLSNDATFYNPHKLAVYVKASHIADVLR